MVGNKKHSMFSKVGDNRIIPTFCFQMKFPCKPNSYRVVSSITSRLGEIGSLVLRRNESETRLPPISGVGKIYWHIYKMFGKQKSQTRNKLRSKRSGTDFNSRPYSYSLLRRLGELSRPTTKHLHSFFHGPIDLVADGNQALG